MLHDKVRELLICLDRAQAQGLGTIGRSILQRCLVRSLQRSGFLREVSNSSGYP